MIKFKLFDPNRDPEIDMFVYIDPFNVAAVEERVTVMNVRGRRGYIAYIDMVGTGYLVWDEDRIVGDLIEKGLKIADV
jgi:hypothetical protein